MVEIKIQNLITFSGLVRHSEKKVCSYQIFIWMNILMSLLPISDSVPTVYVYEVMNFS